MNTPGPAVPFEPYSDDFLADPYPTYRALRDESPVFYDEAHDRIFFSTHADVSRLLRDRRLGRRVARGFEDTRLGRWELPAACPTWTRFIRGSFIDLEPPQHTRLRKLVRGAFTPIASERVRARLEDLAVRVLDQALERGEMEVIQTPWTSSGYCPA